MRSALGLAGYGAGSLGVNLVVWPIQSMLLYFLTESVGFGIALATLVVTTPKVWDIFMDPFIGAWADRSAGRTGHRGRVMLAAAAVLPVSVVTVFMLPSHAPTWTAVIAIALLIVNSSAFMVYFISQVSLADDIEQAGLARRDSALAIRVVGQAIGSLCAGALGPLLISMAGGQSKGYATMALALGLAGAVGLAAVAMTARRFPARSSKAGAHGPVSITAAIRAAWHNRAAGVLIVSNFAVYIAASMSASFTPYMNKFLLGDSEASMSLLFSSFMVAMLGGSAAAAWATLRFPRLWVLLAGASIMLLAAVLTYPTSVPGALVAASAVSALSGFGLGIYALLIFSATIDAARQPGEAAGTGAGLLLGLLISTGKIGDSLGGVLVGAILSWTGYRAGLPLDAQMTALFHAAYSLAPVLAMALSVLVLLPQLRGAAWPKAIASADQVTA